MTAGRADRGNTSTESPDPGPPATAFVPKSHQDSGGGSDQFRVEGGDNSVQEFGEEAGPSEFEAAAAALHNFFDARVERNWAAACSYLAGSIRQSFAKIASRANRNAGCAATLAALSQKVPTSNLRDAAGANAGSLRVGGDGAFLIYRGAPRGTVYAVPMAKQHGSWKVDSLSGTPLS
jgi:hypothetical protein